MAGSCSSWQKLFARGELAGLESSGAKSWILSRRSYTQSTTSKQPSFKPTEIFVPIPIPVKQICHCDRAMQLHFIGEAASVE